MSDKIGKITRDADKAARFLARTINKELGTKVTPDQVRKLLGKNWIKIASLAHAIHNADRLRSA